MSKKMQTEASAPSLQVEILENWIHRYGKQFLYGVAIGGILLLLVFRLSFTSREGARQDYQLATFAFQKLEASLGASEEDLATLETLLERHPELHARYDGPMAQLLIQQGQFAKANTYASEALNRLQKKGLASVFHDFSQTTQLVNGGNYQEAWERNQALSQKLKHYAEERRALPESMEPYQELYAFTVIRQAALAQQLEQRDDELAAWNTLENFLRLGKDRAPGHLALALQKNFQMGSISLRDYIKHRRKVLSF